MDMNNFELIDDYLTNKLSGADKNKFEQQLESDPLLKSEVEVQSQIITGLRQARAAELKAMLNKVPVGGPVGFELTPLRLAAGVVGTALVVTASLFYFQDTNVEMPQLSTSVEDSLKQIEEDQPEEPKNNDLQSEEKPGLEPENEKSEEEKKEVPVVKPKTKTEPTKPSLDVIDPSGDLEGSAPDRGTSHATTNSVNPTAIQVDVDSTVKKYGFHYQFTQGKAILYGDFDKSLYEIIEVNGEKRSVFLFYKDQFYLLDENSTSITELEPIQDKDLIRLLKEYRKR